jgi:hypothetical protein
MKKILAGLAIATMLSGYSCMASASDSSGLYFAVQGGALSFPSGNLDAYYRGLGGAAFTPTTNNGIWGADGGKPVRGLVGLQFSPSFAIEASGIYFKTVNYNGSNGVDTVSTSSKALVSSVTLVDIASGGQPGDYVSLLVKVGMAYFRGSSTVTGTGSLAGGTRSAFGNGSAVHPTYGIAILSDMTDSISLRFDWDSYNTPDSGAGRLNTYLFGLGFKF